MILIIWVIIATISVIIAYIFHGIYIKSFEFVYGLLYTGMLHLKFKFLNKKPYNSSHE